MTKAEFEAIAAKLKADFLAKAGKVHREAEGVAYGVNKDADKAKRVQARRERERERDGTPIAAAVDHLGRTWYTNNEGEVIGHD